MDQKLWNAFVNLARSLEEVGAMSPSERVATEHLARAAGARPRGRGQARVVVGKGVPLRPDGGVGQPDQD
jgi:hypothetical protein